jgi:hypothetical protein
MIRAAVMAVTIRAFVSWAVGAAGLRSRWPTFGPQQQPLASWMAAALVITRLLLRCQTSSAELVL